MLATEQRLVSLAADLRSAGAGRAEPELVQTALGTQPDLSDEQRAMVMTICESGHGLDIVEGVAGAGKTAALAAAHDAWRGSGYEVLGATLSARAAKALHAGSGIRSVTIDRLLNDLDRPNRNRLGARNVIVVDEAAMVGTRKLLQLLEQAERAHAKVVLVGDPCQLPEIDAGGAFSGLTQRLGATQLTQNHRQQEPWEQRALAELRAGDIDAALDAYHAHGRVHVAETPEDAKTRLVDDWWAARHTGAPALMLAHRLRDVDDLNQLAREHLRRDGELSFNDVVLGGRAFAVGDHVLALRNDYGLGVLNGTLATLTAVDHDHQQLLLVDDRDERMELPFRYASDGHLTHGYAMTIHKAQGTTVDRAFVLADDASAREHAYTAMSRGAARNDLYLPATDPRAEDRHLDEVAREPLEAATAAVRRSAAKTMAVDHLVEAEQNGEQTAEPNSAPDLWQRLRDEPPHPTHDLATVEERLRRAHKSRENAEWRRDQALERLDALPRLRLGTRRTQKRDHEYNLTNAERDLARANADIAGLTEQRTTLEPQVQRWQSWASDHAADLEQLRELTASAIAHDTPRSPSVEIDLGIDLGL